MPKAKTGNFTLKKIAAAIPAQDAAHRFAALQRSGQYSELRFIQRGKSSFDIVGYRWPDKGVRRKLGIGRARNPFEYKKGDQVELRHVDGNGRVHWIDAVILDRVAYDANERPVYKCRYELGGKFFEKTCFHSDLIDTWADVEFNPAGEKFSAAQLAKLRAAYAHKAGAPAEILPKFHALFDRLTVDQLKQLRDAKIKFVSALALNELTRRDKKNPSTVAGATPNQVKFGLRGRTVVGWINRETPTKYEISYKVGAQLAHVWRKKTAVKFVATGKRGRVKNNCPKTAENPATSRAAAVELSKKFHHFDPRKIHSVNVQWPKHLVALGPCVRIDYYSNKFDGKGRVYFHEFEKPCVVMAGAVPQSDGTNLLIVKGKFEIKPEGITG